VAGLLTLAAAFGGGTFLSKLGKRRAEAIIFELDDTGSPTGTHLKFQYWPEAITDTKAINWTGREIPGGSLPIYQWISSGERILAFTAVFTCDNDFLDDDAQQNSSFSRLQSTGVMNKNVDVRSAVVWLRRFMFPRYGQPGALGVPNVFAPHKMILSFTNLGLGISGGANPADAQYNAHDVPCIMTQCDVTYVSLFPSGLPRIVEVQLAFAQVAQLAGSQVLFPQSGDLGGGIDPMGQAMTGGTDQFGGYLLQPSRTQPGQAGLNTTGGGGGIP
jgi:hypothetical protein